MNLVFRREYLLGLFCILLCGCSPNPSYVAKYGVAYNPEREKRGIPIIDRAWTVQDMGSYFDSFDSTLNQKLPRRQMKRVFIDTKGIIISETDSFYSGKSFVSKPPKEVTLSQEIIMEYDYSREKAGNPWTIHVSLGPDQFIETVTLEEADRLLNSWGLSRQVKGN